MHADVAICLIAFGMIEIHILPAPVPLVQNLHNYPEHHRPSVILVRPLLEVDGPVVEGHLYNLTFKQIFFDYSWRFGAGM